MRTRARAPVSFPSRSSAPTILRAFHNLPRLAAPLLPGVLTRGPRHASDGAACLYLTFDDGPGEGTPALLDRLAGHGAPALLFFLGEQAARHPGAVRAAVEAGHRVGVHGWTHADAWRTPRAEVIAGFERACAVLEDLTGTAVRAARPPYGRVTPALLRWGRATGRRLVLWDLMPGDFLASACPETVAGRIVRQARPGSVVVLHEGEPARAVGPAALDLALPRLRARGFRPAVL